MGLFKIALLCTVLVSVVHGAAVSLVWEDCDALCGSGQRACSSNSWVIDCHVQDCKPVDGCGSADIVFVLDASGSIGEFDWWRTKQFMIDVMKGLTIAYNESRVAAVVYATSAVTHWRLGDFNDINQLEPKTWELAYTAGSTNTHAGLFHAQTIIEQTARQYVKHLVIVVTDGQSNVDAALTIPRAEEMHKLGIEVFSIGVGSGVNIKELEGMASVPKDVHTHQVSDYDALVAITNRVINDTCKAAGLLECDPWTDWGSCALLDEEDCGDGVSSRYKECRFFLYEGADPDIRITEETRRCHVNCEPCARCDFDDHGIGYLPVEDNCHLFIQCQRLEDGTFIHHQKSCGELFWRPSILNCDDEKDAGDACVDGDIIPPDLEGPGDSTECDKSPGSTDAEFIWHSNGIDYTMQCAPGTVFSEVDCSCVHGDNEVECNSKAMLEFPFNTNYNDICNRAAGTPWGNMKLENGAAFFDGHSKVEIGHLKNWFAENPTTSMTVTLWFKYTGQDNGYEGLFSNGDCKDDASLLLTVGNLIAQGQVIAGSKAEFDGSGAARGFTQDKWTFVALVYSGYDAKYYVNGQMKGQTSVQGYIANTQCATSIGFTGLNEKEHFFEGYIDDVRVYTSILYDYDIGVLYNNGRQ